ncbi:hypothetical protein [Flavobacterium sp.]|uniref:hypothetical protein n=1 Tax=Flavobacterium sp. TaxID=239 RepID=UPI004034DF9E
MKPMILSLFAALLLLSCTEHKAVRVERSFYFWKNASWNLADAEDTLVKSVKAKKLYVKFFEVESDDLFGSIPTAKTQFHLYDPDSNYTVVPVVYLRNEVFKKCTHGGLDSLADNVNFLIRKYAVQVTRDSIGFGRIKEYQMDCDWTPSTKDNYFYFLKKLKALSQKKISCTLRLYPYKYPDKMGVPPVDSAMLMCYNLIHPLEDKKKNTILDIDELASYLDTDEKYPLHLDIALPVYSWAQLYQNNKFRAILHSNPIADGGFRKTEGLWYEAVRDTVVDDIFIRRGDRIKQEEVTKEALAEVIQLIKKNVPLDDTITVALFHLDEGQLKKYSHEEIARLYTAFTE